MNFKRFSVGTTNIFPLANSTAGGQLLTEYNLRCRESVDTDPTVQYMIGKSYVHSEDDFYVRLQRDETTGHSDNPLEDGTVISNSTLEILPGRGIINGYFVESLAPMLVDLSDANASRPDGTAPLKGNLSIGLRIMFSTLDTMSGTMLVENEENVYEGVQIVILPKSEFILPNSNKDSRTDESLVTAHIHLADFIYINGRITSIVNDSEKTKSISAERIGDVNKLLSGIYVTKTGLNTHNHHYVFSSKSTSTDIYDTWCPVDESLMIWDSESTMSTTKPQTLSQAEFGTSGNKVQLVIPHKQVDGARDSSGQQLYMQPRVINLPVADYTKSSCGTVDSAYTGYIKQLRKELNNIYQTTSGKQVGYLDTLTALTDLPPINSKWSVGDYILVRDDLLAQGTTEASATTQTTMYIVLPGRVTSLGTGSTSKSYTGVELHKIEQEGSPELEDVTTINAMFNISEDYYRGTSGVDYFTYRDTVSDVTYYYPVSRTMEREYSSHIFVTGQVGLAQTDQLGGFYNIDESYLDNGYVRLDETGHLQLLDYALLRSGTLAYQLGESYDTGSGLTIEAIQEALDDNVNMRVAFANANHEAYVQENIDDGARVDVIDVFIRLSEDSSATDTQNLFVRGIDSRFNTSVYLHVTGETSVPVNIYIHNCEKIRINNNIPDNVHFVTVGSTLYYDAQVINNIHEGGTAETTKLWYTRYLSSEPNLMMSGMTVKELDDPVVSTEIDYWSDSNPNDLHYKYALDSITFNENLEIIGMNILVRCDCTDNIETGSRIIVNDFELAQSNGFEYPVTSLSRELKLSGSFITAYRTNGSAGEGETFIVYDNNVTVTTKVYDGEPTTSCASGKIAIYVKSEYLQNVIGLDDDTSIDGWRTDEYHTIGGGVV